MYFLKNHYTQRVLRKLYALTSSKDVHAAAAADFAAAVDGGRDATAPKGNVFFHLSVLNELASNHSLEACKRYAASPNVPHGVFGSLDTLRKLILQTPPTEAPGLSDFPVGDIGFDYIAFPAPGSSTVLFVFTGGGRQFGGPMRLLHQWFRRLGVNVVYVFDEKWTYYLGPIHGLGETVDEVGGSLLQLQEELGATSCVCAGNSGGAFGAMLFAPRLKARRTLAYSPPSVIRESIERVRRRGAVLDGLLSPDDTVDLRAIYEKDGTWPPARLYYSDKNAHDRHETTHFRDMPGIELLPLDFAGHNIVPYLIDQNRLATDLEWLIAD